MYKLNFIIKLVAIGLLFICFYSCNQRSSKPNALKQSVIEFKEKNSLEYTTYYPKEYTETKTDTLFSNGYHVFLKFYSNMAKAVKDVSVSHGITYNIHYREFETFLQFHKNNTLIFEKTIDKSFLNQYLSEEIDNNYLLKGAWIDHSATTFSDKVVIDLKYCRINSDQCKLFVLKVSKEGAISVLPNKEFIF